MRDTPAHYIKGNSAARVPDRMICLDTEAKRVTVANGEDQTWSLGVASYTHWTKAGNRPTEYVQYETPFDLWRDIHAFTRAKRRTVLYAHNVGYDVRISQAMRYLPEYGWTLTDARVEDRGAWFKWKLGTRTLILADSYSIFNVALDRVGDAIGVNKLPLPDCDDRVALFERCFRDVEVLTMAMLEYMEWLRTGECGNWQITGAGQSWAHWRHSFYTHKVLVHDNAEALEAEREAMHTGRCEAWRWGEHTSERVYEYDYSNAYPRIARDIEVPTKLKGAIINPTAEGIIRISSRYAVLAEVTVTIGTPVIPAKWAQRYVWPVGRFRTVLWDNEIRTALRFGASIAVSHAWAYRKEPALRDWGEWIISQIHDTSGEVPEWKKLVLKNWSRTLIGRFAMKYRTWDSIGQSPESKVWVSDYRDNDTNESGKLMQIGHDVMMQSGENDGPDYCPQITGYIMAEARCKLWNAIQLANASEVLYMDTDSLLVTARGQANLEANRDQRVLDGFNLKNTSHGYRIYGPRAIILDRYKKVAGLPRQSIEIGNHQWAGQTWESVRQAIVGGEDTTVRIRSRSFHLVPNSTRRHLRSDGSTVPYVLPSGDPLGGYEQTPSLESQASSDGIGKATLALIGGNLRRPDGFVNHGLRYSVRNG